jgi:hypothetical protein
MTKKLIDNGGPAFPPFHDPKNHDSGMSLRDYFAGQALPAVIVEWRDAQPSIHETWNQMVAGEAYGLADAMIKFRGENK